MGRKAVTSIVFLLLSLFLYSYCFLRVDRIRSEFPARYTHADTFGISPVFLEIVSGDFKGLLADYLLLKASYFLGGVYQTVPKDWEMVMLLFEQASHLEPKFFTTLYYTQGIVVWRKNVVERAVDLIRSGHQARDWDWEPGFYAGFDYYNFLHDTESAVKCLHESSLRSSAPYFVAYLMGRFASEVNQTEIAISVLTVMLDRTKEEMVRNEIIRRIKGYKNLSSYEKGIASYIRQFGHPPASLDVLVNGSFLLHAPEKIKNAFYFYDAETGKISIELVPEKLPPSAQYKKY